MKYAVEMGSGAVIYISDVIKLSSGRYTDSKVISYAYFHFFFKTRKVG
jgi:hypothetical protein